MRLLPKNKNDLLVLPLLLWIPVAFLRIVGLQAAKSGEEAAAALRTIAVVTAVLAVPFAVGVAQKLRFRRLRGRKLP